MRWSLAFAVAHDIAWALRRMTRADSVRVTPECWPVLQSIRLEREHGRMGAAIAASRWSMTSPADVRLALGCVIEVLP